MSGAATQMNEFDILARYWRWNRVQNSDGFRASLEDLQGRFDVALSEYPAGGRCESWRLPRRWTVRGARLSDPNGKLVADFNDHPLHLWAYSAPFSGRVSRDELFSRHLLTDPRRPNTIPWRFRQMFRHWETEWGFALPHAKAEALPPGDYAVEIDTSFEDLPFTVGVFEARGTGDGVILLCGHWCHPGMVNDGLSGCAVGIKAVEEMRARRPERTYRMLLVPELTGVLAYLMGLSKAELSRIEACLCLNFLGHDAPFDLFTSLRRRSRLDTALAHALAHRGQDFRTLPFKQNDERDNEASVARLHPTVGGTGDEAPFEGPGFRIPTTSLVRRAPYPEYHGDRDNPDLVTQDRLQTAREVLLDAFEAIEKDWTPATRFSGIPCLSAPDIDLHIPAPVNSAVSSGVDYGSLLAPYTRQAYGGTSLHNFMTQVVYELDGGQSVFDIAEKFDLPFRFVLDYLDQWRRKGLLGDGGRRPDPSR